MSNKLDIILAEISAGELVDKITILEIKKAKISNKEKLIDINRELSSLNETVKNTKEEKINVENLITATGLQIKKDSGVQLIYSGFAFLIISTYKEAKIIQNETKTPKFEKIF